MDSLLGQLGDFEWSPHPAGFQARGYFSNNFGISVIPESDLRHYEVAILRHENGAKCHICYDSGLCDDVFRYASVDNVHSIIMRVRNLREGTRVVAPDPYLV